MSFAAGTKVRDTSGSNWSGTVEQDFVNAAGQPQASWQFLPPNFPANYNSTLVLVRWNNPSGIGQLTTTVYVAGSSLAAI